MPMVEVMTAVVESQLSRIGMSFADRGNECSKDGLVAIPSLEDGKKSLARRGDSWHQLHRLHMPPIPLLH